MVRLVFRPYTQVGRSICTSESLRTSTRVSSGFVLLRHSSPSFGSQRARSCSASLTTQTRRAGGAPSAVGGGIPPEHVRDGPRFHFAFGFRTTQRLARMLDSLVRVSRRVGWRAYRFATDPVPAGPPRSVPRSGRQTRSPSLCQSNISGGRGGPRRRRLLGPRCGSGQAGLYQRAPRSARLPSPPPSDRPRTGRGALPAESAHGRRASRAGRVLRSPARRRARSLPS